MVEHTAFGMIIGRLFAGDCGLEFRQHVFQEQAFLKQRESKAGVRCSEEFRLTIANALGADAINFGCTALTAVNVLSRSQNQWAAKRIACNILK